MNQKHSNKTNQPNDNRNLNAMQSTPAPPINMHMQMNLSPMTREIEKLREHLSGLINSMIQVQTEQKAELSRIHRSKEDKKSSGENPGAESN